MYGKRFIDVFLEETQPELALTSSHVDDSYDIEELNETFNINLTADIAHF